MNHVNIFYLLEQCDRRLFFKIKDDFCHPLYHLAPKAKVVNLLLINYVNNTERFKDTFFKKFDEKKRRERFFISS